MKTMIEWYLTFPEPYKSKAIVNIAALGGYRAPTTTFTDIRSSLDNGFDWQRSPEGRKFWEDFRDNNCAPPPPHPYEIEED